MRKSITTIQKEARAAQQYVLLTCEFGQPAYIADSELCNSPMTDKLNEALKFAVGYDNQEMKLSYYTALTGLTLTLKTL